jgi:hypothetical protein
MFRYKMVIIKSSIFVSYKEIVVFAIIIGSHLLQNHRSRVRFPVLPDFLVAMGLERGPLSPCEDKCGAT